MKNISKKVLGAAVISAIAIGTLAFVGGCKSQQEVLKDRPFIPAPEQGPSAPAVAPAVVAPIVVQPAPAPVKIVPEETVVPK